MAEQISDAKIKATEKEHSETFDSIFVNDGDKVRQVTKEKARELMGVTSAETAIEKLNEDSAETKRKLDYLWKLNQGISYQYETDSASAYQKDIPSGAKVASVNKVGGKTVVWNQLADVSKYDSTKTSDGITYTNNEDGSITINGTGSGNAYFNLNFSKPIIGHKYLLVCENLPSSLKTVFEGVVNIASDEYAIGTALSGYRYYSYICTKETGTEISNVTIKPQLYDLTMMFGAGNEPSTVAEFEAMFPADYYPYNAGTLMSAPVNEVVEQGKNLIDLEHFKNYSNWKLDSHTGSGTPTNLGNKGYDLPCKPNVNYTISKPSNYTTNYLYLCKENADGTTKLIGYLTSNTNQNDKITFSISGGETAYIRSGNTTNESIFNNGIGSIEWIQLEKASSATPYSPYHKTTYPIPEAITQIDGYGRGITDDVRNYVDWENRVYHKCVREIVLNGTENWTLYGYGGFGLNDVTDCVLGINEVSGNILSNGYMAESYADMSNNVNDNAIALHYAINRIILYNSKYTTVDDWKEYLANAYSSGNPIRIIYELATEVVTNISDLIGDTFQNPFEVEACGTLTFKNSNGDDYRIPVPNEEEYLIALAEVTA